MDPIFENDFEEPKWKQKLYQYRFWLIGGFILLVIGVILIFTFFRRPKVEVLEMQLPSTMIGVEEPKISKEDTVLDQKTIIVDIKGAVNKPGVYVCKDTDRVNDVIQKASGMTKDADSSVTNLSAKVKDEMVIRIYTKQEVENCKSDKKDVCSIKEVIVPVCPNEDKKETENKNDNKVSEQKISINSASLEELSTVPGIGEAKAKAIIEYRKENGLFNELEGLLDVKGIGQALYEKILPYITL